jgi:hypothetical protein
LDDLKANLSAIGDGIIASGLGIFVLSLAYAYYQSIQPNISSSIAFVVGFFVLGASVLVAGVLKIGHAVSSLRDPDFGRKTLLPTRSTPHADPANPNTSRS